MYEELKPKPINWGRVLMGAAALTIGAGIASGHIKVDFETERPQRRLTKPKKRRKKRKRYAKTKTKPQTKLGKERLGTIVNLGDKKLEMGGVKKWQV